MDADFLVVGSGIAGLTCALRCASGGSVLLVTKDRLPESSSQYAQGGIASVWSPDDSFESHIEDTLGAGAGLCHRDVVEIHFVIGMVLVRPHDHVSTRIDVEEAGSPPLDVVEGARGIDAPAGAEWLGRGQRFYDMCRHGRNYSAGCSPAT